MNLHILYLVVTVIALGITICMLSVLDDEQYINKDVMICFGMSFIPGLNLLVIFFGLYLFLYDIKIPNPFFKEKK